jgi:hypothetical protein
VIFSKHSIADNKVLPLHTCFFFFLKNPRGRTFLYQPALSYHVAWQMYCVSATQLCSQHPLVSALQAMTSPAGLPMQCQQFPSTIVLHTTTYCSKNISHNCSVPKTILTPANPTNYYSCLLNDYY